VGGGSDGVNGEKPDTGSAEGMGVDDEMGAAGGELVLSAIGTNSGAFEDNVDFAARLTKLFGVSTVGSGEEEGGVGDAQMGLDGHVDLTASLAALLPKSLSTS
jgi:hypothetical protein